MHTLATFHPGEQAMQARSGALERLAQAGPRVIRDHMPQQHRDFFPLLPFLLAGSVDESGQPWASLLAGPPGFAHSPDPQRLRIDAHAAAGDPLAAALRRGAPLGLLGIQPHTRRRNRMNGTVGDCDAGGFTVEVGQSFGNCPKYIQPREAAFVPAAAAAPGRVLDRLDGPSEGVLRRADTFFIATAHPAAGRGSDPAHGVDVSHRGGEPGFVRVQGDTLEVPDYVGNHFFNTLGNLLLEPRCGLLFMDPQDATLLQLTARAEIVHAGPAVQERAGALRLLRLHVTGGRFTPGGVPLRWSPSQ